MPRPHGCLLDTRSARRGEALIMARGLAAGMRPVIAVLALALLATFLAGPVAAQDPIQVLDIDTSYERTVAPGATTTFNWTVRNSDVNPILYDIEVTVTAAAGWTAEAGPARIDNLSQNRAAPIRVNVTAPPSVSAEAILSLNVVFTAYQDDAIVFVTSRAATITVPSIYAEKKILGFIPNFLPAPLDNEWGAFLLDVVLWAVFAGVALLIAIPLIRKAAGRTKTQIDDIVIRIVRTPFVILLFLYGALQSLETLDRHIDPSIRGTLFAVYQVALTLIILFVAYRLFKDVLLYLGQIVAKKTASHVDDVLVPVVEKVGLVVIGIVGLGVLLGYLNVDLTLFVAGGVVISMVIAFAAQDTISNFFSGLFILADRPFKEGDIVILSDGDWVEVRRIGMRTTRLFRFSDASLLTVPNNKLVNEKIANFTNPRDRGRMMKTFNVAYGSDPLQVKGIIEDAIKATPHVFRDDPALTPIIRFDAMSDSSLDFFVLFWIDDRANRFTVQDVLNTEVYTRLNAAGIEIPFPQRTVHVRVEGAECANPPVDVERIARRLGYPNVEPQGSPSRGSNERTEG